MRCAQRPAATINRIENRDVCVTWRVPGEMDPWGHTIGRLRSDEGLVSIGLLLVTPEYSQRSAVETSQQNTLLQPACLCELVVRAPERFERYVLIARLDLPRHRVPRPAEPWSAEHRGATAARIV
jgi:hypothetical protein